MGNILNRNSRNSNVENFDDTSNENENELVISRTIRNNYPRIPENPRNTQNPYILDILDSRNIVRFTDELCCICLNNRAEVYLNCKHSNFCYNCIVDYIDHQKFYNRPANCPMCRTEITKIYLGYLLEFKV